MSGPVEPELLLRDYQRSLYSELVGRLEGPRGGPAVLVHLPTGGGKTRIAVAVAARALRLDGGRVLFVVNRSKLVPQIVTTCETFGLAEQVGFMKAGLPANPDAPFQVGSIQTLYARRDSEVLADALPPASVVFIDEAHGAVSASYAWLLRHYRRAGALVVGLTATPVRLRPDEQLSAVFPVLLRGPSVPELMRQGVLVPTRTFYASRQPQARPAPPGRARSASLPSSSAAESAVAPSCNDETASAVDAVVRLWQHTCVGVAEREASTFAAGVEGDAAALPPPTPARPTLVFATDVAHALQFVQAFKAAGVTAACVSGETSLAEREALCDDLASGRLAVLCSVNVLSEGCDVPAVAAVVLARPTRSAGLYIQQVGRGLRQHPGKADCVVLDVAGNSLRHGPVTEAREPMWVLSPASASGGRGSGEESGSGSSDDDDTGRRELERRGGAVPRKEFDEGAHSGRAARAWVCQNATCCGVSPMASRACTLCGAARPLSSHQVSDHQFGRGGQRISRDGHVRAKGRHARGSDTDAHLSALLGGLSLGGATGRPPSSAAAAPKPGADAEERIAIPRKKKADGAADAVPTPTPPAIATPRPLSAISPAAANATGGSLASAGARPLSAPTASADGACAARPPATYVRLPLPPPGLPTAQQWGAVVAPGRSSGPPIALGAPLRLVPASLPLPVTGIQRPMALPSPPKGGRPLSLRPDSVSASGTGAAPQRPLPSAAADAPKAPSAALL